MRLLSFFLIVIICFLFGSTLLRAQNLQDVVYLKNGSVIRGMIMEQVPNKSLKIQTADGSLFVFLFDDIEKITKEPPIKPLSTSEADDGSFSKPSTPKGHTNTVKAFGGLPYSHYTSYFAPGLHFEYTFNNLETHNFGIGAGIESIGDVTMIPIYVVGRIRFGQPETDPYAFGNLGYTLNVGLTAAAGVGTGFEVGRNMNLMFEAGGRLQAGFYYMLNLLTLSVGLNF